MNLDYVRMAMGHGPVTRVWLERAARLRMSRRIDALYSQAWAMHMEQLRELPKLRELHESICEVRGTVDSLRGIMRGLPDRADGLTAEQSP